jgi:dolichol kinase
VLVGKTAAHALDGLDVEAILWILLAVCPLTNGGGWPSWISLVQAVRCAFPASNADTAAAGWRQCSSPSNGRRRQGGDYQGLSMSVVLLPFLFYSMARSKNAAATTSGGDPDCEWSFYAKCTSLLLLVPNTTNTPHLVSLGFMVAALLWDSQLQSFKTIIAGGMWILVRIRLKENLAADVVTHGELFVLSVLLSIGATKWIYSTLLQLLPRGEAAPIIMSLSDSQYISLTGVLGCALGCAILIPLVPKRLLLLRLVVFGLGPLLFVEVSLSLSLCCWQKGANSIENNPYVYPRCLVWLVQFLTEREEQGSAFPRYYGLVYWAVAILVLLPPSLWIHRQRQKAVSVVVTRKWFHLVAVILFGPITVVFPKLMSLSYAIALCGLVIIEGIRPNVAALQDFFEGFLDTSKDASKGVVLSHMALIMGCAAPLWISECVAIGDDSNDVDSYSNTTPSLLYRNYYLPLWGVLCLGIGDSMAALVGKLYGRAVWGKNGRTLEGSCAMWWSLVCVGFWIVQDNWQSYQMVLVVTTVVTLLEAFTAQMDNLVLPLAGSAIILMLA